jgi:hypothetical protein
MKEIYNKDMTLNEEAITLEGILSRQGLAAATDYVRSNDLDVHQVSHLFLSVLAYEVARLNIDKRLKAI